MAARVRVAALGFCLGFLLAARPARAERVEGFAPGSDTLTVRECVIRARTKSPEPAIAAAERDAATLDSTATFRTRRLAFSITGGALVAPENFYDPAFTNLGEYTLRLGAESALLDGGARRRDRNRSGLVAAESRVALAQAMRDAGLRAGVLAVEWLRLAENLRAQKQAVDWLDHHAIVMESGVRSGLRDRADAVTATLERDATAATLDLTHRDLASASRALAREMGLPRDSAPAVRDEEDSVLAAPSDADSLALIARFEQSLEVRLAMLSEAERRLDLEAARKRQAWKVDLSADAGLAGTDLTHVVPPDLRASHSGATLADRLRRDLGASVSLQLKRPLFDPSASPAEAARQSAIRAQQLRREAEVGAGRRLALELIARWRSAAQRFGATRAVVARAEEHLLRLESLHAAGAATLLELLDARRTLDEARERLTAARADLRSGRLEVEERR